MFIHHEYLQLKTILSALIQHSFYISHFLQNQKIKNKILKKNNNNSVLWKKNGSSANPDKSIWQCDRTTNVDYQCAFLFMMLVPSLNCVRILLFFFFSKEQLQLYHVQDFQAFSILFARYLMALTPPTATRPDTACLALETITLRLKTPRIHSAASSLEPTTTSRSTRPEITA